MDTRDKIGAHLETAAMGTMLLIGCLLAIAGVIGVIVLIGVLVYHFPWLCGALVFIGLGYCIGCDEGILEQKILEREERNRVRKP